MDMDPAMDTDDVRVRVGAWVRFCVLRSGPTFFYHSYLKNDHFQDMDIETDTETDTDTGFALSRTRTWT